MRDLSIIIVNYNVKHFLAECLRSVFESRHELDLVVFVVDNNSVDRSVEMVRDQYPQVRLIANQHNAGFAAANNQAIMLTDSRYVLLLNPDTILEEATLQKCFDYMELNPECGALGVKMIDGSGKFLPESKRGFPTPFRSLMRLIGFSRLFPRSRFFNGYNMGYLPEDQISEVDVLCGAFMFIRKKAMDQAGLLDEAFFMYGEDIDYSYRIQQAGYKIVYFPETTIIHFKGESTKKSSLRYHKVFYTAMAIFARKHFGGKVFNPFLWLINASIFFIGLFHFIRNKIAGLALPFFEFTGFYFTIQLVEYIWAKYYFNDIDYYAGVPSVWIYSIYSLAWVTGLSISGAYHQKRHFLRFAGGILAGTIAILIIYALLDNSLRSSRAIILISALFIFLPGALTRLLYSLFNSGFHDRKDIIQRVLVVGKESEVERAKVIMSGSREKLEFAGAIYPLKAVVIPDYYIQSIDKLDEMVRVYKINQVFFSPEDVEISEVMFWMTKLGTSVKAKIMTRDVLSIIGSHDRNARGDLYTIELRYKLSESRQKFLKSMLDYLVNIALLVIFPVWVFGKNSKMIPRWIIDTTVRNRSWVGYIHHDQDIHALPEIPQGILSPIAADQIGQLNREEIHRVNFLYARDYSVFRDLEHLLSQLPRVLFGGGKPFA